MCYALGKVLVKRRKIYVPVNYIWHLFSKRPLKGKGKRDFSQPLNVLFGYFFPSWHTQIMDIKDIHIIGGKNRQGRDELVGNALLRMGDIVSIVGPTGSGKTALIKDIELYANENTPTGRKVLINGVVLPEEVIDNPSNNPIALITQHTNFLSDLPVRTFLEMHAQIRESSNDKVVGETLHFANELTGEPIIEDSAMTELSGGQTRALLIADAVIIGSSPIILLDEIENAGIDRKRAVELLRGYEKIFIFVTHDLGITLLSDYRIVMKNGGMERVIETSSEERVIAEKIKLLDDLMVNLRNRIRDGEILSGNELEHIIKSREGLWQ